MAIESSAPARSASAKSSRHYLQEHLNDVLSKRIEPFRPLLYNQERIGDLSKVVAPPYDLIDAARQDELYQSQPVQHRATGTRARGRSLCRVRRDAGEVARRRYPARRAAPRHLSIFATVRGPAAAGSGAMVSWRACGWKISARGRILPHEKTFPAAKADRLKLLTALNTNVSSIFGLYSGTHAELDALISNASAREPLADVIDDLGIENQLRAIDAPEEIAMVQARAGIFAAPDCRRAPSLRDRAQLSRARRIDGRTTALCCPRLHDDDAGRHATAPAW